MPRRATDQLTKGRAYFRERLPDVSDAHFGALWHLFTLGHLVATDLDAIARPIGFSFADLDLLGTLAVDADRGLVASELASALYVSEAVVSTRIARLVREGLVTRAPLKRDRRAYLLTLTPQGHTRVEAAIREIARHAKIARYFADLGAADQQALLRILGLLHARFDRDFVKRPQGDD